MSTQVPKSIVGRRIGGEPEDPLSHFYVCAACRQPVDMRDLGAVFHHEEPGHDPLPLAEAFRLLSVEDWRRAALMSATPAHRRN
jgi:hypothetical protein